MERRSGASRRRGPAIRVIQDVGGLCDEVQCTPIKAIVSFGIQRATAVACMADLRRVTRTCHRSERLRNGRIRVCRLRNRRPIKVVGIVNVCLFKKRINVNKERGSLQSVLDGVINVVGRRC